MTSTSRKPEKQRPYQPEAAETTCLGEAHPAHAMESRRDEAAVGGAGGGVAGVIGNRRHSDQHGEAGHDDE